MGTEIKAAAIAAALGAFAGGAPGEAPVGTEQRSNAGAHLVPGAGPAGAATMRAPSSAATARPRCSKWPRSKDRCLVEATCSSRWSRPQYIPATTSS